MIAKGRKNQVLNVENHGHADQLLLGFDVITSIVSFLWAHNTAAPDVTSAPHSTSYDVTSFSNLDSETVDSNMAAKQETYTRRYEQTGLFHFTFNATLQDTRYHVNSTL